MDGIKRSATYLLCIFFLVLLNTPLYSQGLSATTASVSIGSLKDLGGRGLFAVTKEHFDKDTAGYKDFPAKEFAAGAHIDEPTIDRLDRADRKKLLQTLRSFESDNSSYAVTARSKLYYKLANVFVHLHLYPLAMKCFFKTRPVVNKGVDTIDSDPSVKQDTITPNSAIMSINSTDDSLLKNNENYIKIDKKSKVVDPQLIANTFNDGKRAVAYAMLFHVKQPVAGKPKVFNGINSGHTFITLIKYNADSSYVSFSFGFYPKKQNLLSGTPLLPATTSQFKNDLFHDADEVLGKFISKRRFEKMLLLTQQYDGLTYHLSKNNCTDFGLKAAEIAGIHIEETRGDWPLGTGNNPGMTGQSILKGEFWDTDDQTIANLYIETDLKKERPGTLQ